MTTGRFSSERPMAPEPWLTKRELARQLQCSTRTIERLGLPAMRVGGQNRYRLTEVEAHLRGEQRRAELVVFPGMRGSEPAA
jgi:excisionase family DNA binding protein